MNRLGRAAVLLALGAVILRLLWSGGFGWFVQQHMKWPLTVAAVVLVAMGLVEALAGARAEKADPESARRPTGPVVGWMLALPLLVLIAVAPTGLGAAAADRVASYTPSEETDSFEPLPPSDGPVPMRVFDFLNRAVWDENRSLEGVEVVLEGLVVNDDSTPDGFKLTRFMVSCCAADGIPLQVLLRNVNEAFADDTWVQATVVWRPPSVPYTESEPPWTVEADVVTITAVPNPPDNPYESPY